MSPISTIAVKLVLFLLSSAFFSVQPCPPHERNALLMLKSSLNDTYGYLKSWKGDDCCVWAGVNCSEIQEGRHVIKLDLLDMELSGNYFHGEIPFQLGNLYFLRHLDLSSPINDIWLTSSNLEWLSNLSSLEYLSLSNVDVREKNWGSIISSLLHLKHLDLSVCHLQELTIPSILMNLSSLTFLDFSGNSFSSIPIWLRKLSSLTHLAFSGNNISGSIHNTIGNLTGLQYLDLSWNALIGQIPLSLEHNGSQYRSLFHLDLWRNNLEGTIPSSLGLLTNLTFLDLSDNQLTGNIPSSLGNLHKLTTMYLENNQLNGSLPLSFAHLSSLKILSLSNNNMNGMITELYFQKSFSLKDLHLSHSGLMINISSTWIPSFQLDNLFLENCHIGGPVPSWISTQLNLFILELSFNQLMGNLPSWLWDIAYVSLSNNHLQGSFTPTSGSLLYLDLSMNELSGHLPVDLYVHLSNVKMLILADNKFEGKIPSSLANLRNLSHLNLCNNSLRGIIPSILGNLTHLQTLFLENNRLEGEIPMELGSLSNLEFLRIGKNTLQGVLPSSLAKLSRLQALDVGENNFIGNIPLWIANFSSLNVLVMRDNNFKGNLPPEFGQMPKLQVLDFSSNLFSGVIPQSYFRFRAMQNSSAAGVYLGISADLIIKGHEQYYEYIFSSFIDIDLSNNRLKGPLPLEIQNLKGLKHLNLSMNSISGPIPESLGNLVQLESLDLSFNNFSGEIPHNIGNLTFLAYLNLSYNNLCGRIPYEGGQLITFDESSYIGNSNLWGCPLEKHCSRPIAWASPTPTVGVDNKRREGFEFPLYWMCFGLSMGLSFSGVVLLLVLKLDWRIKCFAMMDKMIEVIDIVM